MEKNNSSMNTVAVVVEGVALGQKPRGLKLIIIIIIIIIIYIALFSYSFMALYKDQVNVEPKS